MPRPTAAPSCSQISAMISVQLQQGGGGGGHECTNLLGAAPSPAVAPSPCSALRTEISSQMVLAYIKNWQNFRYGNSTSCTQSGGTTSKKEPQRAAHPPSPTVGLHLSPKSVAAPLAARPSNTVCDNYTLHLSLIKEFSFFIPGRKIRLHARSLICSRICPRG